MGGFLCQGYAQISSINFASDATSEVKLAWSSANKYNTIITDTLKANFPEPITDQYINLFTYHNSEKNTSDNDNRVFSNVMCLHITPEGICSLYGLLDASSAATTSSGIPPGTKIHVDNVNNTARRFASSFTYICK